MTDAKPSWRLRRLQPSDEAQVIGLFRECLAGSEVVEKYAFDYWVWENQQVPDGSITLVADDNGRLVGYYGMVCRQLKIANQTVKAALSIDNMVHPLYRRQGMYVAMDKLVNELAHEFGAPISMGFPNELARPGHRKAAWHEILKVPTVIKVVDARPVLRVFLRNNPLSPVFGSLVTGFLKLFFGRRAVSLERRMSVRRTRLFDARFDKLWASASQEFTIAGVRDSKRLNWRFGHVPHRRYVVLTVEERSRLLAYVVIRTVKIREVQIGLLVDLLAAPQAE
jgi:hypothetical protein